MSEATLAEPPAPPAPPAAHPGAVTIDLGNLGNKPKVAAKAEPTDAEKATANEAALAAAEAAKVAEAKKAAEVKPPEAKPNDKEENMANLRKAREAAEAAKKTLEEEYAKLKTDYEEFKSKAPELPEDVKAQLAEREALRQRVRQVDLASDPEFQAKYNKPIMERISMMGQLAIAAGVPEAEWKKANAEWDRKQMAEWSEGMDPLQKIQFNTAWMAAENLWQEQQTELKNADTTYQELQKKRQADAEAQQKQYFSQNEQLAKSVIGETIKPETLKEYEDLGPAVENIVLQAARHEIPAKDIFQQLAANQVLARVTKKQASRIEELEKTLAERDKKITDLDAFVANNAAGVPRGDAAGASGAAVGDNTPLWKQIVVKAP